MDNFSLIAIGSVAFGVVGIAAIVWLFLRDRKRQGIGILESTEADKVQLQKLRRELNPLRFLTGFLAAVGGLAVLAGMASVAGLDSSGKIDWRGGVTCFVFGGIFISVARLLSRLTK